MSGERMTERPLSIDLVTILAILISHLLPSLLRMEVAVSVALRTEAALAGSMDRPPRQTIK